MGNVYVIATPIGNLDDITFRAINILKEVKYIFCEDTNHSKILLSKYEIRNKKLYSLNMFNESSREKLIVETLKTDDIAIISDAGTPTISDPGQFILKKLREQNYNLIPIPGSSSIISALSVSGEIFDSFSFYGFMPKSAEKIRETIYQNVQTDISIYFEASNRIEKTLTFLRDEMSDFPITLAKEITKKFEKVIKDNPTNLLKNVNLKGEFVLIINNKDLNKHKQSEYLIAKNKENFSSNNKMIDSLTKNYKLKKAILYDIIRIS